MHRLRDGTPSQRVRDVSGTMERRPRLPAWLRCTSCGGELGPDAISADDVSRVVCLRCAQRFPVRWGIPDLRRPVDQDPFLTRDEDLRAADRLFERAVKGDFASALGSYYAENSKVTAAQARQFTNGVLAAADRSALMLETWCGAEPAPFAVDGRRFVDVGCGTAPLAIAASRRGFETVGIDIGMRWLVLAAARAREAGGVIHFACAAAEALPFADASVDVVAGESILENAASIEQALREAARVLRAGGRLWFTTPNRWSVGPDPHVGLPLGGWLPDTVIARYATSRGMVPPQRRLVGAGDVRRLLVASGFAVDRIVPPAIAAAQRQNASAAMKLMIDAYLLASGGALGRQVMSLIGPTLVVAARRRN